MPVYDDVHANAIELDRDGHLLVSARNTSAIYKVDRSTGDILWRLGGKKSDFKMGAGATFGLQHDPRRQADGTLTVFDDGTAGPSRGIVLNVDEVAMTATLVKEYPHPHGKFAMSQGNVQILPNGNVFVGWGSTGTASEFTPTASWSSTPTSAARRSRTAASGIPGWPSPRSHRSRSPRPRRTV